MDHKECVLLLDDGTGRRGVARRIGKGDGICSRAGERIGEECAGAARSVGVSPEIGRRITIYVKCAAGGGKRGGRGAGSYSASRGGRRSYGNIITSSSRY